MRAVVVGAGIVGLATARRLIESVPGAEVVVLEKDPVIASHQTAHNSGVVHAGLYYAPGSLKARLCRRGLALLRNLCAARAIPYEACGKLVIATAERELEPLRRLAERAAANQVPGLRWVEADRIGEIEPNARGLAALHSPETAIVDFAAVARVLATDLVAAGGKLRTAAGVVSVRRAGGVSRVELLDGSVLIADRVVVCAGLHSDRLARASGEPAEPRIVPFRGEYWKLRPERSHLVRGLIYPVPNPALPFLGVHLTRKIDGSVWLGPNAILSPAREGYRRGHVDLHDLRDMAVWPGTFRMMRRHWRAGVAELARSASKRRFVREAQRYVPALDVDDAIRADAGIRAQALDRDGSLVDDFRVNRTGGAVWVRNAPSPAATSALAIAEELVELALR
ncbi:MAG TPA: L-2-hydroxyglutarate oxidase [Solirubrobacteraceae bacterium]|nr:L-2-hydroxyglutarate oxidase [Solirubrobacteraceae bacterium]